VPVSIRGETEGGEQFLEYFRSRYPDLTKELKFNIGSFEDVKREMLRKTHFC